MSLRGSKLDELEFYIKHLDFALAQKERINLEHVIAAIIKSMEKEVQVFRPKYTRPKTRMRSLDLHSFTTPTEESEAGR